MQTMEGSLRKTGRGAWPRALLLLATLSWALATTGVASSRAGDVATPEDFLRHKYPVPQLPLPEPNLPPSGGVLVRTRGCLACHTLGEQGGRGGVDLSRVGRRLNAEALERLLLHPRDVNPEATMPSPPLTPGEALAVAEYLSQLH